MNINDLMFQAVSQLTGGLITDMTSLLLGMVTIFFLAIGFDKIRDVIIADMNRRYTDKAIVEMRKQQYIASSNHFDPVSRDIARARYRKLLSGITLD